MAKKNNNNGVENKSKNNDTNNNEGGEKTDGPIASKVVKSFQGAESVKSEGQVVSPQHKKDNKVNKYDADDTKKRQPEKTDDDEKPKEAPFTTAVLKTYLHCEGCASKVKNVVQNTEGCYAIQIDREKDLLTVTGSMDLRELAERLKEKLKRPVDIVPPRKKKNGGDDGDDGNDGGGDEKKKKEDEGNGGGKMKYPAGRSGFVQFSYGKVYRHRYGYQNGALKTVENMLLLCCEVVGLLVMYNHLAKDIYTALHTHHLLYI